ncbi:MAG: GNAT family N-acetyltransferase [Hyphomicrobiales bacterium]|nr:GNAT family N-acetyltransferase [Hyphomicrobiales bacterium]
MDDPFVAHQIVITENERVAVLPVNPRHEGPLAEMLAESSPEDVRFRCCAAIKGFPQMMAARLVYIDPQRETTLIAQSMDGRDAVLGVVHIVCERKHPQVAEFDIMVRTDHKGHGLGYRLMQEILCEARRRGLSAVEGFILRENRAMLLMARELGFKPVMAEGDMVCMRAELSGASSSLSAEVIKRSQETTRRP